MGFVVASILDDARPRLWVVVLAAVAVVLLLLTADRGMAGTIKSPKRHA